MSTGLSVLNTASTYQITESYIGFGLKASGTLTATATTGSVTISGCTTPLIAFYSSSDVKLYTAINASGTYTYSFRSFSGSVTVNYFVFDKASSALGVSGTNGLVVYDASGNMLFHSAMKPLRIVGAVNLGYPPETAPMVDVDYRSTTTLTSGRTYALIEGTSLWREEQLNTGLSPRPIAPGNKWMEYTSYYSGGSVSSNIVYIGPAIKEKAFVEVPTGTAETIRSYGSIQYWIIDVTNY